MLDDVQTLLGLAAQCFAMKILVEEDCLDCLAEFSLAPYRLGLTATPERTDGRHEDLPYLVGPLVYRREAVELAGEVLAPYRVERVYLDLSRQEREAYERALEERNRFLQSSGLNEDSRV